MDRPRSARLSLMLLALASLVFVPALRADNVVTFTLSPDVYNVTPGSLFTVYGTITQSQADVLTNMLANVGPYDCSQFDCSSPDFHFDPAFMAFVNQSSANALALYSGAISEVPMLGTATPGYSTVIMADFFFTDGNQNLLAQTSFTVNVVAPVPEPASLLLLGSGFLGLMGPLRRRLQR